SMVELIKEKTDTHIIIGQNGIVWIKGENKERAAEAVRLVDKKGHEDGLTEKVENFLEKG
ncbi:MAG: RNA-binding protein, partial [Candidatus Aenigmatarchaeota archaeon]